jgi:citrate lyase subunit beta/citryl-CoA lyase
VPGSDTRKIAKAAASLADEVLLDLEDACAPSEKDAARGIVVDALRTIDFRGKVRAVRVNGVETAWCHRDIIEVVGGAQDCLDAIIVPKIEDAAHVQFVDHLVGGIEMALGSGRTLQLELLIELPVAMTNLREIARASNRTVALVFGSSDYAAAAGVTQQGIGISDPRYPGHQWHAPMSEILAHARSVGAQAIDGACGEYSSREDYEREAMPASLLGFDGKWCIHPNQIEWTNSLFTPTGQEVARAERILAAYDAALAAGLGAISVDGRLVDEVSRKAAAATLARAAAGATS